MAALLLYIAIFARLLELVHDLVHLAITTARDAPTRVISREVDAALMAATLVASDFDTYRVRSIARFEPWTYFLHSGGSSQPLPDGFREP